MPHINALTGHRINEVCDCTLSGFNLQLLCSNASDCPGWIYHGRRILMTIGKQNSFAIVVGGGDNGLTAAS
jgi:hypothetical protein